MDFHQCCFISLTFEALEILALCVTKHLPLLLTVCVVIVFCRCGYPKGSMMNLDHLLSTGSASRLLFLVLVLIFDCMLSGWGTIWFGWHSDFFFVIVIISSSILYKYLNARCLYFRCRVDCKFGNLMWGLQSWKSRFNFQSLLELVGVF